MKQENGFFQIEWRDKTALCHIYPPQGGVPVGYKEISAYLDSSGFSSAYNPKSLQTILSSDKEEIINLGQGNGYELSASMDVSVDIEKMTAYVKLFAPSTGGSKITAKDFISTLNSKGVKYGIDQDLIMDLVNEPVYCTEFVIARGKAPVHGHDGYVEYFFNVNPNTRPSHNEDGTVDFHNIDVISHIMEGDLLARLHPEDKGEKGCTVLGMEIMPKAVKPVRLSVGRNIKLSEDLTEAYSEVTGHARMYNGQIFVSDVYEVPADVDNSTGNINYKGNVEVKGCVREGFTIIADGDVVVEGAVEGAQIIAGGQIIIKRGINGMSKGLLQANGNIVSKFIENAKVVSQGYVETGSIINSEVSARGDVVVAGRKGFITGGTIKAGGKVEAMTIGSEMGGTSKIEIGVEPEKKERYNTVQKEILRLRQETAKIQPVIVSYAEQIKAGNQLDAKHQAYYVQLLQLYKTDQEQLTSLQEEFMSLHDEMEKGKSSKVVVSRDIFPGVTIVCGDLAYTLRDKRSFCSIEKGQGEIVFRNL